MEDNLYSVIKVRFLNENNNTVSKEYAYGVMSDYTLKSILNETYIEDSDTYTYPLFYIRNTRRQYDNPVIITDFDVFHSKQEAKDKFELKEIQEISSYQKVSSISDDDTYKVCFIPKTIPSYCGGFIGGCMSITDDDFWEDRTLYFDLHPYKYLGIWTENDIEIKSHSYKSNEENDKKYYIEDKGEHSVMTNNLVDNLKKDLYFGKVKSVGLSIYGPSFYTSEQKEISYNTQEGAWVDVTGLTMDNVFAYAMPVAKTDIKVNDFIRNNNEWVRVIEIDEAGRPMVEKMASNEIVTLMPVKNMFGFDFYTKLMTFDLGGSNATAEQPFGNMLPFMLMSGNNDVKDILPMLMMTQGNLDLNNPMMMMMLMGDRNSNTEDMMLAMMMMNTMNQNKENK